MATRRSPRSLVVCVAASAVVLSGCGSGGSSPGTPSPGSATIGAALATAEADLAKNTPPITTYPAIAPVPGASGLKGKTVWYIPNSSAIPVVAATGAAMQTALASAGIEMHVCDGKLVPTTMAACMSQAVAAHADAVVTGYIDYALIPAAFDDLAAHNVKVLVAGEAPSGGRQSSAQLAFYDITDSVELVEKLAMQSIMVDSGGKAEILFVGITNSSLTRNAAAYATSFITQECPGCTLHEVHYATAQIDKLPAQVSAALLQYPNTNYVAVELDSGDQATIQGIQAAGATDKVKLVSSDGNLDALQRVKAGTQLVDIGQSPVYSGWSYADGIIRMLAGQPVQIVETVNRVFNKKNVQDLTLTPEAYATNDWYGTDAYKATFLKAWGVS